MVWMSQNCGVTNAKNGVLLVPESPLITAARSGHYQCASVLLEYAEELNISNSQDETALSIAIGSLDYDMIELLVDRLQEVSKVGNSIGMDEFIKALKPVHERLLRKLVDRNIIWKEPDVLKVVMFAFEHCSKEFAQEIVSKVADINRCSQILHLSVKRGWRDVAELLLDRGINVNSFRNFRTALCHACVSGSMDMVSLLLHRGADPNAFDDVPLLADDEDRGPFLPVQVAVAEGHLDIVKILITRGAFVEPTSSNESVNRALTAHLAANQSTSHPLLQAAVEKNFTEIVQRLLLIVDSKGNSLLHRSVENVTCSEDVEFLLQHCAANPNLPNLQGDTALHVALNVTAKQWNPPLTEMQQDTVGKIVEILLKYGADPKIPDASGMNALYLGSKIGYLRAVKAMLEKCDAATLNFPQHEQYPLYAACECSSVDVVRCLLAKGASPNFWHTIACRELVPSMMHGLPPSVVVRYSVTSPLDIALDKGLSDIVGCLLNYGADVNMPNQYNSTLLSRLHEKCQLPSTVWFQQHKWVIESVYYRRIEFYDSIKKLLRMRSSSPVPSSGPDHLSCLIQILMACTFISQSSSHLDLLFEAVEHGFDGIVGMILKSSSEELCARRNNNGDTALHVARSRDVILELLSYGSDVEALDSQGLTPLHRAVIRCAEREESTHSLITVQTFLEMNANVNALTRDGKTPLYLAAMNDGKSNNVLMRTLKDRGGTLPDALSVASSPSPTTSSAVANPVRSPVQRCLTLAPHTPLKRHNVAVLSIAGANPTYLCRSAGKKRQTLSKGTIALHKRKLSNRVSQASVNPEEIDNFLKRARNGVTQ